jgi:hypothetical protein
MAKKALVLCFILLQSCLLPKSRSAEAVLLLADVRSKVVEDFANELEGQSPEKAETIELEEPLTPFGTEILAALRRKGFPVFVAKQHKSSTKGSSYIIDSIGQGVIACSFSTPRVTISRIYTTNVGEVTPQGGFTVLRRDNG